MNFRDYAKLRGYKLLETPESVMEELREIAMHYRALEEKNLEKSPDLPKGRVAIISWLEILCADHKWFSLSILGINIPKNFIDGVMLNAFRNDEFNFIPAYLQLTALAVALLLMVEANDKDIILAGHQKQLLILFIDTLIAEQKIDEHLLAGPVKLNGFEKDPEFTKKYISAVSKKLAGIAVEFKNPSK